METKIKNIYNSYDLINKSLLSLSCNKMFENFPHIVDHVVDILNEHLTNNEKKLESYNLLILLNKYIYDSVCELDSFIFNTTYDKMCGETKDGTIQINIKRHIFGDDIIFEIFIIFKNGSKGDFIIVCNLCNSQDNHIANIYDVFMTYDTSKLFAHKLLSKYCLLIINKFIEKITNDGKITGNEKIAMEYANDLKNTLTNKMIIELLCKE